MSPEEYDRWWLDNTDADGELLPSLPEPVRTLAAHVQALQERIDKLCAYDHPDAMCAVHKSMEAEA